MSFFIQHVKSASPYQRAGAVFLGLMLVMGYQPVHAQFGKASASKKIGFQVKKGTARNQTAASKTGPSAGTDVQVRQLQAKLVAMQAEYAQKMAAMQASLLQLNNRLEQLQTGNAPNAVPAGSQAATVNHPPPGDQDIGEALIFGPDETSSAATQSPALMTSSSALAPPGSVPSSSSGQGTARQTGWSLGGRNLYNGVTQLLPNGTAPGGLGQSMNPDIVVSGDFLGHYGSHALHAGALEDQNRIGLREAEFGFSAPIDPYAKATFIFSKPESDQLEVEEGYVTLLKLPYGLQGKIGKMRSPFGKINAVHGHDLPQADRPSVYQYFFGQDGLIESGAALSALLPTPWYSSLDVQVGNGDTGPYFGHGRLDRPMVVSHWKNFWDITGTQSLELGLSGAIGNRDVNNPLTTGNNARLSGVEGIDLTYHWVPPTQRHAVVWQSEVLAAQAEQPAMGQRNNWGGYSFVEYKLSPRWSVGTRVDYTQIPFLADAHEFSIAPYVNFWESEFARWRLEYKHTFANGQSPQPRANDQLWAQYSIILGLHPPHTF